MLSWVLMHWTVHNFLSAVHICLWISCCNMIMICYFTGTAPRNPSQTELLSSSYVNKSQDPWITQPLPFSRWAIMVMRIMAIFIQFFIVTATHVKQNIKRESVTWLHGADKRQFPWDSLVRCLTSPQSGLPPSLLLLKGLTYWETRP